MKAITQQDIGDIPAPPERLQGRPIKAVFLNDSEETYLLESALHKYIFYYEYLGDHANTYIIEWDKASGQETRRIAAGKCDIIWKEPLEYETQTNQPEG